MAKSPLVSVCVTSYNHAGFLPAALDSILNQTFRDFELIVVDDGSSDQSMDILEDYARKYAGVVRVLTHPGRQNLGPSESDNLALREARGDYWCTQPSDDISYRDRLERQVAVLQNQPGVGWAYGVADLIGKKGEPLRQRFGSDLSAVPELVEELILENRVAVPTLMVRMQCMKEIGNFEPGLMYGDWEFLVRLAARFKAAFLPAPVAAYRQHDYNTSITPAESATQNRILEACRYSLEVVTTLRRKAAAANGQLGRPRTRALLDLKRAAILLLLREKESASRAAAEVFRSDPSFRDDLKHLAHCLGHFKSLRLPLMMIRELGYPPRWLRDKEFTSALVEISRFRLQHSFRAGPND